MTSPEESVFADYDEGEVICPRWMLKSTLNACAPREEGRAMFDTLLFTCAICEHEIRDYPKRTGRYRQIAPICSYCQKVWAKEPGHGAFMDRRIAAQIDALALCISTTAHQKANPIPANWREL